MLRISIDDLYRQEVEFYTHRLSSGNLTPLIYDMLKGTNDLDGLLEYLGYHRKREEKVPDSLSKQNKTFMELFEESVEVSDVYTDKTC